ncbi:MAG: PIN domain-containing protein [Syntrophobacterales bacterium]|nr:PIN domain-containing protein [Syntrophobacterales bacterium]
MYLLDTNIWLERLLNQDNSPQVEKFLDIVPSGLLWITDFSLHSISIVLLRLGKRDVHARFIDDLFLNGAVNLICLDPEDSQHLIHNAEKYGLDFDDAYQMTATMKHRLTLISFDRDFDRTPAGRKTPTDYL